jgi:prepilin-type processing-associated H-X9-DG protein
MSDISDGTTNTIFLAELQIVQSPLLEINKNIVKPSKNGNTGGYWAFDTVTPISNQWALMGTIGPQDTAYPDNTQVALVVSLTQLYGPVSLAPYANQGYSSAWVSSTDIGLSKQGVTADVDVPAGGWSGTPYTSSWNHYPKFPPPYDDLTTTPPNAPWDLQAHFPDGSTYEGENETGWPSTGWSYANAQILSPMLVNYKRLFGSAHGGGMNILMFDGSVHNYHYGATGLRALLTYNDGIFQPIPE